MRTGRPKPELVLSKEERDRLRTMAQARSQPIKKRDRARIVLLSAEGESNASIARRMNITEQTVGTWRQRFVEQRIAGLRNEVKPGRPRLIDEEQVTNLIQRMTQADSKGSSTRMSVRQLSEEVGLSKSTIHRYCSLLGLETHKTKALKHSSKPFATEKLRDVVGLYLNDVNNSLVLCVDENSQGGSLQRTKLTVPLGLEHAEGAARDFVRHCTKALTTVLDGFAGTPIPQRRAHFSHMEFLCFLQDVDKCVPQNLKLHAFVCRFSGRMNPRVKAWLEQRPRWHMHNIPEDGNWLHLLKRFALISEGLFCRDSLDLVGELITRIEHFCTNYDEFPTKFVWITTSFFSGET